MCISIQSSSFYPGNGRGGSSLSQEHWAQGGNTPWIGCQLVYVWIFLLMGKIIVIYHTHTQHSSLFFFFLQPSVMAREVMYAT